MFHAKMQQAQQYCYLGIKVAPIVKKRGRPRGYDLTTIGLPAKKTKRAAMSMTKPSTFSRLDVAKKEEGNTNTNIHLSCTQT